MNQLKKLLTEHAPDVLPDEQVKENIRRELGYARPTESEAAYAHGGTVRVPAKKVWIALTAGLLAAAIALSIALPLLLPSSGPGITFPGGDKFLQIKSTSDFYAYGAASVGSILSSREINAQTAAAQSDTPFFAAQSDTPIFAAQTTAQAENKTVQNICFAAPHPSAPPSPFALEISDTASATSASAAPLQPAASAPADRSLTAEQEAIAETVNGYMALVEELLSDSAIEHETTSASGEFAQYTYHTAVFHADLLGNRMRSDLYYDIIPLGSYTDDDEIEEYYAIEGILVPENGIAYPMIGRREAESEEDETESETQFTAYLNEERTAYIRMEQESSQETDDGETETEQKFIYTYNDGTSARWTERTIVEYEKEDDELELKMTVQKENGRQDEIVFSNEDSRNDTLFAEATVNGVHVEFTITIVNENGNTGYRYNFGNGQYGEHDRFDDDDDDYDNDDDDDRWHNRFDRS